MGYASFKIYTFQRKGAKKNTFGLLLSGKISGKITGHDFHILFSSVVNYSI